MTKVIDQRTCDACRQPFEPTGFYKQRFCSVACRNAYHRTMAPESLRKDIDALRAALAEIKAMNEALSRRADELEAAAARCGA